MPVKSRRKAREVAVRALYEMEVGHMALQAVLAQSLAEANLPDELSLFAKELITGVREHQAAIDDKLASVILEWDFERIAAVDRNVLRVAAFELYHCSTIPPAVTINEAIEIGKKYSTAESGKFINGVLGRVLKDSPKADWAAPEGSEEELASSEQEPEPEIETIEADSDEARHLAKMGGWKLKKEGDSS